MIEDKLKLLPKLSGCYLMRNKEGIIIYVGKAKNLKNRVTSYFRQKHTGKTKKLVSEIHDFDYIVVNSELESFILELNLIKEHDPKYNILLRDDKTYPYIELTNEKYPRLLIVRHINKSKANNRLYGPYPNVFSARETVNLINRIYPLRKCKNLGKKTCLYYHINECLGYCTKDINDEVIDNMKEEITNFLKGDIKYIKNRLENKMLAASNSLNFEHALEYKQLLDNIIITSQKQKVEVNDFIARDVFGYAVLDSYLMIVCFFIRGGKIVERHFNTINIIDDINEELTRYIAQFYDKGKIKPKELLVPNNVDINLLSDYLGIKVITVLKGVKRNILDMASNNASILLNEKIELLKREEVRTIQANDELKELLNLNKLDRIEIFDNSNLFGTYNVSGMVVFINGKPSKKEYRKYKLKHDINDDYYSMFEVLNRRYTKVLNENLNKADLIIVDGGIGQVNIALKVLSELKLQIPVIGLRKDKNHRTNSIIYNNLEINVAKDSNLFAYLERMQNEIHNFTINYHKQIRSKGSIASILDNIDGIGETRKEKLLKRFSTIDEIKKASINDISEIIPQKLATYLKEQLERDEYDND